jgi:hypothetical protein
MVDALVALQLYDASLLQGTRDGSVTLHLFERTVVLPRGQGLLHRPLQMSVAVKERNGGKLNSHACC